jgi:hypothetical protein
LVVLGKILRELYRQRRVADGGPNGGRILGADRLFQHLFPRLALLLDALDVEDLSDDAIAVLVHVGRSLQRGHRTGSTG